jgi:hypothetical protein
VEDPTKESRIEEVDFTTKTPYSKPGNNDRTEDTIKQSATSNFQQEVTRVERAIVSSVCPNHHHLLLR